MVAVVTLIVVVVAGIALRFVGGGDNPGPVGSAKPTATPPRPSDSVLVTLFSSSTKRDWLNQVVEQFNAENKRTATGETIRVEASHTRLRKRKSRVVSRLLRGSS